MDEARHEQIVALGKEPISADHPVGDPIRYDETFEALQAQLDRIGSLTGEEPDWRVVVELASAILKSKSKDLLVMTYLTVGLFEQEGYAGLAAGLEAYREFLSAYWESCFPKVKPPHGRYNAVQYLADRIHPQVELKGGQCRKQPADSEKEAVHNCAAQSEELVKAVGEAFSAMPDSPNLLSLNRAFRALKEKVGPLQVEAPPAEAAPADGA
ncbi:MAG: type VI secretion system ImpA family N-terminal domain-containing protein, partial [Planctomycetes bacterium]|nr:type VI secretion system ImpA family N-terminal domain-containing protein [Planctomycetota bacterium]